MKSFIDAIATEESPLCLFLDDIQWADEASLLVIQSLLANTKSKHILLVLLAYRDTDSNAVRVEEILKCPDSHQRFMEITKIVTSNLDIESVDEMIRSRLQMASIESLPLSECVWKKTMGNCFLCARISREIDIRWSHNPEKWFHGSLTLPEFNPKRMFRQTF